MKRLWSLCVLLILATGIMFAQSTNINTSKQQVKKTTAAKKLTNVEKKLTQEAKKNSASTKAVLKADGTPDMRYKVNQMKAAPVKGPKKKDGTADMRYKVNQTQKKN